MLSEPLSPLELLRRLGAAAGVQARAVWGRICQYNYVSVCVGVTGKAIMFISIVLLCSLIAKVAAIGFLFIIRACKLSPFDAFVTPKEVIGECGSMCLYLFQRCKAIAT